MESAVGEEAAKQLLADILADEKKEQGSSDFGCICEIDLTQRKKIKKIMSRLLYPPKTTSSRMAATTSSESEEAKEETKEYGPKTEANQASQLMGAGGHKG